VLEVDIDKILPVTEARDSFNKIVDEVEDSDHMYVLTKNGKPSAVVVGVNHLEKLTGKSPAELTSIVEQKAGNTPVVEEVPAAAPQAAPPVAPVQPQVPPISTPPASSSPSPAVSATPATDQAIAEQNATLATPPETPAENQDDLFV